MAPSYVRRGAVDPSRHGRYGFGLGHRGLLKSAVVVGLRPTGVGAFVGDRRACCGEGDKFSNEIKRLEKRLFFSGDAEKASGLP